MAALTLHLILSRGCLFLRSGKLKDGFAWGCGLGEEHLPSTIEALVQNLRTAGGRAQTPNQSRENKKQ